MGDESSGPVEKLVLLQQCCCDKRCSGSHHAVLAVIVDACYDKPRCFIGPTAIGQIAGLDPRTVRGSLRDLEAWGYLTTEKRNSRSDWYSPNFEHAQRTGQLVEWDKEKRCVKRVHRPAYKAPNLAPYAGPQVRPCGSADPAMRAHRPEEAIDLNHSKKAFPEKPALSPEEQEQERLQEETLQARLRERARSMYSDARDRCDLRTMEMIELGHRHRIEDLIPYGRLEAMHE